MSRWHQMLKEIHKPLDVVQIVQNVQKKDKDNGSERSEHFEHVIEDQSPPSFDADAYQERSAVIEANGIPREWAEGYAILCTMPRPAAYRPECWQQIVDDGGYFLDQWGRQAAALGWRAVDVFGVDPGAPEYRYDGMGLVSLLAGRRVCAITADTARIDCGNAPAQTFYRRHMATGAVALWEVGRQ